MSDATFMVKTFEKPAQYINKYDAIEVIGCTDALARLRRIKPVDVEPVRHGRWILERDEDGKPYCFHCSVCDDDFHHIGITVASGYCPNCGAKMGQEDLM